MFRDPGFFRRFARSGTGAANLPFVSSGWPDAARAKRSIRSRSCLREEGLLERSLIYATDINTDPWPGRAGVYPIDRVAQFSDNYLAAGRHAVAVRLLSCGVWCGRVRSRATAEVVFADHSLATDNVFSEVHLVSCRNVLIYFDRELQDRALGLFREALVRRGFLGLGSKESLRLTSHAGTFAEVCAGMRDLP